jgi:hypothetical protein
LLALAHKFQKRDQILIITSQIGRLFLFIIFLFYDEFFLMDTWVVSVVVIGFQILKRYFKQTLHRLIREIHVELQHVYIKLIITFDDRVSIILDFQHPKQDSRVVLLTEKHIELLLLFLN